LEENPLLRASRLEAKHASTAKPEQLQHHLAIAGAVISLACSKVKQRMTLRATFFDFFF
jgi:hypothetical protein